MFYQTNIICMDCPLLLCTAGSYGNEAFPGTNIEKNVR